MYACNDSAAPAHARTRAHRPAAPRQSSGVPACHRHHIPRRVRRQGVCKVASKLTSQLHESSPRPSERSDLIDGASLSRRISLRWCWSLAAIAAIAGKQRQTRRRASRATPIYLVRARVPASLREEEKPYTSSSYIDIVSVSFHDHPCPCLCHLPCLALIWDRPSCLFCSCSYSL